MEYTSETFEVAAGSVTGADHVWAGRPNQDAWRVRSVGPRHRVVVVADGCSDGAHSEVGAWVGVHLVAEGLAAELYEDHHDQGVTGEGWEWVRTHVTRGLDQQLSLLGAYGPDRRRAINDFLLFTLVVGVIGPVRTTFAAIGDGYLCVNGREVDLGTFPDNMPPYVAYGLTRTSLPESALRWRVLADLPTAELESFVVGTDGMRDFAASGRDGRVLPGTEEPVGGVSQFWEDDRYYRNPDMVRRRLVRCNGGVGPRASVQGILRDDTTLVVGRRKRVAP